MTTLPLPSSEDVTDHAADHPADEGEKKHHRAGAQGIKDASRVFEKFHAEGDYAQDYKTHTRRAAKPVNNIPWPCDHLSPARNDSVSAPTALARGGALGLHLRTIPLLNSALLNLD
jgi:hypothetical protein